MKKILALLLALVMVLGLAACGTVNKTEVSVLWSGNGEVKAPNSLINAMERAMYSVNISYKHYGANGDQAAQTSQAQSALDAGCSALVVELVDAAAAQTIVDAAKAKNVPVVFFNCAVEEAVVKSYNKCVLVDTDVASMTSVLGQLIGTHLTADKQKKFKEYDRNGDGKISYLAIGASDAAVEATNKVLAEKKLPNLEAVNVNFADLKAENFTVEKKAFFFFKKVTEYGKLTSGDQIVELIFTENDASAMEIFTQLQAMGFNKDKLATHFVPVYTTGDTADYKALVLADRPEGAHNDEAVQNYYESKQYILDLRNVEEKNLPDLICTTANIIGDGRLSGSAIEDYDGIAVATATILRNLLKGADTFKDIEAETVTGNCIVKIPYTTIG